jgi:hypothetical protein
MPEPPPDDARIRLRGARAGHGIVIVVAVVFIASSTWQIARAVFPELAPGGGTASLESPGHRACAAGLRDLAEALDRAASGVVTSSVSEGAPEESAAAFRRGLSPEWNTAADVERSCSATAEGQDAWAALERLRSAEEQLTRRSRGELGPLRRDLAAHLPSDLR